MRVKNRIVGFGLLSLLGAVGLGCGADQERIPLIVDVGGRSMSKLPFVIAAAQGLYEKHGLDVELRLPPPDFDGGIEPRADFWTRVRRRLRLEDRAVEDINVNGQTPAMVALTRIVGRENWISIGATDCSVRYYILAQPGIDSLEQLKGGRLGVNRDETTSGFAGMRLIERMGWDRTHDISVMEAPGVSALRQGWIDAYVGGDNDYENAQRDGFNVLLDTRVWNDQLAGNSILVRPEWLEDSTNREAAIRLLRALVESIALFHQQPELVIQVMEEWYGMPRDVAEGRYARTDYIPIEPYPCIEGIRNTMALYDSHEMRRYVAEDFYDDSLMREIDESGFSDRFYDN